jgi:hypothetical protein
MCASAGRCLAHGSRDWKLEVRDWRLVNRQSLISNLKDTAIHGE